MFRDFLMGIVLAILVLAIVGMIISWWRRKKRQADLAVFEPVPQTLGELFAASGGLYLATTPAGDRYNRIAVGALGFRARLTAEVRESGILLPFPGSSDIFIPAGTVSAVGSASWTIDRGMEPDGLTKLSWSLGDTAVESYFRFENKQFL